MTFSCGVEERMIEEIYININPLQTGGRTTAETRKAVFSWIDGYSVCDSCKGALRITDKPPIRKFLEDVSEFLGMSDVVLTNGAREAKFAIMHSLTKPGDWMVVDGNAHYSTLVAAERNSLNVSMVPSKGYPTYEVVPEKYSNTIEEVIKKTGKKPALAVLTHVDGNYGNVVDAKKVSKICHEYDVPLLLNAAYSSGRMPVSGKKVGADFIVCSAHKSWAIGGGNGGILAVSKEYEKEIIRFSKDFPVKLIENIGCSMRSSSVVALISAFPHIKERVKRWEDEVKKFQYVAKELSEKEGFKVLGKLPKEHDLITVETPGYDKIAKTHKRRGYFLAKELKKKGIVGIKPGRTKMFKFSTYGLSRDQIKYLVESFLEILEKHENR
ncbi:MAG: O-phospho-L-seryl-tRNA:Cys-tRNA synthase [Candidatus Methanofastidiosia archaeon]